MSGLLLFYLVSGVVAGVLMCFGTWWDMKKDPTETITVANILLGVFFTVCPVVNTIVAAVMTGWFIFDVCPKIVVFGPKR